MQKTAYDMRISDWSSDVCSSDLIGLDLAVVESLDHGRNAALLDLGVDLRAEVQHQRDVLGLDVPDLPFAVVVTHRETDRDRWLAILAIQGRVDGRALAVAGEAGWFHVDIDAVVVLQQLVEIGRAHV